MHAHTRTHTHTHTWVDVAMSLVVHLFTELKSHHVLFTLTPGAVDKPHPVGGSLIPPVNVVRRTTRFLDLPRYTVKQNIHIRTCNINLILLLILFIFILDLIMLYITHNFCFCYKFLLCNVMYNMLLCYALHVFFTVITYTLFSWSLMYTSLWLKGLPLLIITIIIIVYKCILSMQAQ